MDEAWPQLLNPGLPFNILSMQSLTYVKNLDFLFLWCNSIAIKNLYRDYWINLNAPYLKSIKILLNRIIKTFIEKKLNWKPWLNLMKPVLTMIPHRRQIPRPQYVLGTTSPYPTHKKVMATSQRLFNMFPNSSSWCLSSSDLESTDCVNYQKIISESLY